MLEVMKKRLFFVLLVMPQLLFALTEIELETLQEKSSKNFSESPWRFDFGLSISGKENLNRRYPEVISFEFTPVSQDSLLSHPEGNSSSKNENSDHADDNSSSLPENYFSYPDDNFSYIEIEDSPRFFYRLQFTAYYSLRNWKGLQAYPLLRDTELFIHGGFLFDVENRNCGLLKNKNNLTNYLKCGVEDVIVGSTTPVYKKDNFFSFFDLEALIYPISKRSQDIHLTNYIQGSFHFLYFLKKEENWSLAVSSSHAVSLNRFSKPFSVFMTHNRPFNTTQGLSLILQQSLIPYLPANVSLDASYDLALANQVEVCDGGAFKVFECGSRWHFLHLSASSSWRIFERAFLSVSLNWRDQIAISSPLDEKAGLRSKPSFKFDKWYFAMKASYSF